MAILIGSYVYLGRDGGPEHEFVVVQRQDIFQEVNVTGRVKPAQKVDLQFGNSGRVAFLGVAVGDTVNFGNTLASLDTQEIRAQILEKEAAVDSAKADLSQTMRNFDSLRDENVATALRTELENAKVNLTNVQQKADGDLVTIYNTALNATNEALVQANSSLNVLKYLRAAYEINFSKQVKDSEKDVEDELFGLTAYNKLGAKDYVSQANLEKSQENINVALAQLVVVLDKLKSAFSILQFEIKSNIAIVSSSDRDRANTEANAVASELSETRKVTQDILSQKSSNNINISYAEAKGASAQAAFPTQEDVDKKQSAVKQAEAALLATRSQFRKLLITASFSGVVSRVDVELGETVSPSTMAISLVSVSGFQIEANLPEVDVAKVQIGGVARLTLDAYGRDIIFEAQVIAVDPAETIIEGVAVYKATFKFIEEDERIKSGMTANINISGERRENVISIPQRAIIRRNGEMLVRILDGKTVREISIETGLRGSRGTIEVLNGISEGDKVITFFSE